MCSEKNEICCRTGRCHEGTDEESILLTGAKSYEQAAEEILAMGPKLVAITLGEQGVLMATKSRKEIIKAFQTHAVDTTGQVIHSGEAYYAVSFL